MSAAPVPVVLEVSSPARDERASPGRVLLTARGPGFGAGLVALGGP